MLFIRENQEHHIMKLNLKMEVKKKYGKYITEVNGNKLIITRTCGEYKAILRADLKTHDFNI
jgi:sucrose phosphorylase